VAIRLEASAVAAEYSAVMPLRWSRIASSGETHPLREAKFRWRTLHQQTGVNVEGGCTLNWGEGNIGTDPYFIDPTNDDFHLKSQAGRWNPESQVWIQDEVTSPCIDAGDLMSPIGWELFPNGGFVNMGAYGGTSKASKSYFGEPICETIVAGDINGDGQVNQADLEIMALHWTDPEPLQP
jgi:hypothetical protein